MPSMLRPRSCPRPMSVALDRRHKLVHNAILLILVCAGLSTPVNGRVDAKTQNSNGCALRLHVDGLRNSNGVVGSVLFKSADGWPENISKAFRTGPTAIPKGQRSVTVVWENLPPGDYGVAAIHDENSNAKLDRNLFGIPKEGFGFANNPHVVFSAPAFRAAIVHLSCPSTDTDIHLQYK